LTSMKYISLSNAGIKELLSEVRCESAASQEAVADEVLVSQMSMLARQIERLRVEAHARKK
jgi:hypothetical protein